VHKASKAAPRVAIYTHKDPVAVRRAFAGERIHRAESITLHAIDRELIDEIVARLDRRMKLELTVTEGTLYVTMGSAVLTGDVVPYALTDA
jgi:uncharacterized protein YaeQ